MSQQATPAPQKSKPALVRARHLAANNSTLLVALLLLIVFGLTANIFVSPNNIYNIFRQMAVVATLGIGMTLVILIGGIDLSVGSTLFMAAGLSALLLDQGQPTATAVLVGVGAATCVGLLNGVLVEIVGISPVVATLGTLIGVRGLTLVLMNNAQIRVTDAFFEYIAVTRLPAIPALGLPGFPLFVIIVFILYLIMAVIMSRTFFGRYLYAIGGNQTAARLCGIPVLRYKVLTYVLCGFFAGIGGLLMSASTGVISPNLGAGSEFYTIAAVVLGGTRLSGGVGRVEKTLLGAFTLYMVLNYMTIRRIPTEWQQAATGLLVLAAVVLERLVNNRRDS